MKSPTVPRPPRPSKRPSRTRTGKPLRWPRFRSFSSTTTTAARWTSTANGNPTWSLKCLNGPSSWRNGTLVPSTRRAVWGGNRRSNSPTSTRTGPAIWWRWIVPRRNRPLTRCSGSIWITAGVWSIVTRCRSRRNSSERDLAAS
uniref:(northern house mosquito) hypothetical protein n=1 Tax=Culex pipiens TaxID=7175 RepID=A0A8D8IJR1_CULPI